MSVTTKSVLHVIVQTCPGPSLMEMKADTCIHTCPGPSLMEMKADTCIHTCPGPSLMEMKADTCIHTCPGPSLMEMKADTCIHTCPGPSLMEMKADTCIYQCILHTFCKHCIKVRCEVSLNSMKTMTLAEPVSKSMYEYYLNGLLTQIVLLVVKCSRT